MFALTPNTDARVVNQAIRNVASGPYLFTALRSLPNTAGLVERRPLALRLYAQLRYEEAGVKGLLRELDEGEPELYPYLTDELRRALVQTRGLERHFDNASIELLISALRFILDTDDADGAARAAQHLAPPEDVALALEIFIRDGGRRALPAARGRAMALLNDGGDKGLLSEWAMAEANSLAERELVRLMQRRLVDGEATVMEYLRLGSLRKRGLVISFFRHPLERSGDTERAVEQLAPLTPLVALLRGILAGGQSLAALADRATVERIVNTYVRLHSALNGDPGLLALVVAPEENTPSEVTDGAARLLIRKLGNTHGVQTNFIYLGRDLKREIVYALLRAVRPGEEGLAADALLNLGDGIEQLLEGDRLSVSGSPAEKVLLLTQLSLRQRTTCVIPVAIDRAALLSPAPLYP